MQRHFARKGDKTTADGTVLEGEDSFIQEGLPVAFHGAQVYCPACNSTGVILAIPPHHLTDDGGTYVIDSCIGAEGINVYLRTGRTHTVLKHFYGYFNYEVAGNCLESAPSQK